MLFFANFIHITKTILFKIQIIELIYYKFINKKYHKFLSLPLTEESIVIDIGANVGTVSQFIYNRFNCNIECYEPNKHAFKALAKRFKKINKVKCFNFGIAEKNTIKKIYFHKYSNINQLAYSSGSSFLKKKLNVDHLKFEKVKVFSINEIIEKYKIIDLIKIDIEGYEYKILPDIIKNNKKIKHVVCELHGNPKSSKDNFLNNEYINFKKSIKDLNLSNDWFEEHF